MSKSKKTNARGTDQKNSNKNVDPASKKPRVLVGREWEDIDVQVDFPNNVSKEQNDAQPQKWSELTIFAFSAVLLLFFQFGWALITHDTTMLHRVMTTIQFILAAYWSHVSGSGLLALIAKFFGGSHG